MTNINRTGQTVQQPLANRRQLPALVFLVIYVGLLLVIPTRLVIPQLGAPGTPANLWAILGLLIWTTMTLGGLNPAGRSPMRTGGAILGGSVLLSYVAGHFSGWLQPADIHQSSDQQWQSVGVEQLTQAMVSASDRGLLAFAGWAGVLLMTVDGLRSWRDLETLVAWLVRFTGVSAALGVIQYFTGLNIAAMIQVPGLSPLAELVTYERSVVTRVVGTAGHPIELGVVMAAVLPLALHHSLFRRTFGSWIPTALIGLVVLMSVSRSAVVVAAGAMIVLFIGWPNKWRVTLLVAAPFALLAGRAALPGLLGTIRALFASFSFDPSVAGRTDDYPFAWRAFSENPLLGQGLFTWVPMYYRTLDNQFLVLLLELGLIGTFAFAGIALTGVICGISCRVRAHSMSRGHLGLAFAAGLIGLSLSYATFDALGFRQAAGMTFLLLGLAGASWRLAPYLDTRTPDLYVRREDR